MPSDDASGGPSSVRPPPWPPVRGLSDAGRSSARLHAGALAGVAAGVAVWLGVRALSRASRRVEGQSMQPSLRPGELVIVLPAWGIRRGDVVVVRDPRHPERETVKRVLGLPGELVELGDRQLVVDGVARPEPWLPDSAAAGAGGWRVPPGHVVVLGDNRGHSTDSRTYGPVPRALVVGRVVAPRRWSAARWARRSGRRPVGRIG